jgi:RHS repeat-associated protein
LKTKHPKIHPYSLIFETDQLSLSTDYKFIYQDETCEYQNFSTATNKKEFYYDKNGNMTSDSDRNIVAIRYNILNLPDTIQFYKGNQIINRYAADGRKLGTEYFTRVIDLSVPLVTGQVINQAYTLNVINQNGTAYIDNKEYNTFNGNSSLTALQRIYNSEGFADTITATIPNYKYYRRDHLGNNRELWVANTKKTLQRTQYYPSGLPWASNTGDNPGVQERKYNGKEFVEMHGYDTYDYGARGYYPAMGRFTSVDPMTEKYPNISPYAYCADNPVNRFDPDGQDWYTSNDGKITYWQKGNEIVDGYTNSETYTLKIDKNTMVTFTQNDATSVTFTGINKSDYVSQTGKTGCKDASDEMLASNGVNSNGERINMVNANANGVATTSTKKANKGINAVDNALENGHPIEVGVDYSPVQLHNKKSDGGDGMTDHFIVISSKTEGLDNGQVTSTTYNFFDPRQKANGTNPLNTFTRENNMLKGAFHGQRIIPYTVTTVRTSSR